MTIDPKLPKDWLAVLADEFKKSYFVQLKLFLLEEKKKYLIYPRPHHFFNAFYMTPFDQIKVVILGQDPYHGPNQAHGLAFSVPQGIPFPPSLQNIFKELQDDIGCMPPLSGNLEPWARQGVFLLNTVLSVRANEAHAHKDQGWEQFTDAVIATISSLRTGIVFILWGRPAQSKRTLIDLRKHLVLEAPHPSPLSAYRGFFGSKPFSNANRYIRDQGGVAIDWCL